MDLRMPAFTTRPAHPEDKGVGRTFFRFAEAALNPALSGASHIRWPWASSLFAHLNGGVLAHRA